jgi:murein DD-endopeptidase MepM/ murein hydrolase activator NlpD
MKKFTLLIVPRLGGKIREFTISPKTVLLALLFVLFGVFCFILTIKGIRPFLIEKEELNNLRAENQHLEEQLLDMTKKVILLKKKISFITDKESEIRKLADIIEDNARLHLKMESSGPAPAEIKKINSDLEELQNLSTYYDSLFTSISARSSVIDRIPTIRPVCPEAYISARFGMKNDPFSGKMKPHLGVDFAYKIGAAVVATAAGSVSFAGKEKGFGKVIRINHGYGFTTMYAHLDDIQVREGQNVAKGQKIGTLGNTGRSIGPHLHYEIIKDEQQVDPELYF